MKSILIIITALITYCTYSLAYSQPSVYVWQSSCEMTSTDEAYNALVEPYYDIAIDDVSITVDVTATVEDLKHLDDYDVAVIVAHGYMTTADGVACSKFWTGEVSTDEKDLLYADELETGQIVKRSTRFGTLYYVLPKFFEVQFAGNKLAETVIFSECCQFMGYGDENTVMAEAMISGGAESVIGFHNNVGSEYSFVSMIDYIGCLADGKTSKQAFDYMILKNEDNQKDWYVKTYPNYIADSWYSESEVVQASVDEMESTYPMFLGDEEYIPIPVVKINQERYNEMIELVERLKSLID